MSSPKRAPFAALSFASPRWPSPAAVLGATRAATQARSATPIVAATVNGRPIYIEDVRAHAVARGWLQEGRGPRRQFRRILLRARRVDPSAAVRHGSRSARAWTGSRMCAANSRMRANECWPMRSTKRSTSARPIREAIERLYRENASRLGQGEEVHLRHIQFETREAADAAKRRLEQGERFEALAFELQRPLRRRWRRHGLGARSPIWPPACARRRARQCRRPGRADADADRQLAPFPRGRPPRRAACQPGNAAAAHRRLAALPGDHPTRTSGSSATPASSGCASLRKAGATPQTPAPSTAPCRRRRRARTLRRTRPRLRPNPPPFPFPMGPAA